MVTIETAVGEKQFIRLIGDGCIEGFTDLGAYREQYFPSENDFWSWMKDCVESHPNRSHNSYRLVDAKYSSRVLSL